MNKLDKILKKSSEIIEFKTFDVDQEWDAFLVKYGKSNMPNDNDLRIEEQNKKDASRHILYMLSFAATLIVVFSCIFLFKSVELIQDSVVTVSESRIINLRDGSIMEIDSNSAAKYYVNISHLGSRDIFLSGGATFDVKGNILPFRVFHQNVIIEVLGTQFSIAQKNEHTEIINIKGSVKVLDKADNKNFRILTSGDTLFFKNGTFVSSKGTKSDMSGLIKPPIAQNKSNVTNISNNSKVTGTTSDVTFRKYTLESVVKNYLLKYNKKKLKIDKKNKPDLNHIVQIDDINKSYISILEDLKRQGVIDFVQGDCPDCYIIRGPKK